MFTGIIEEVGRLAELVVESTGARLRVRASKLLPKLSPGASVAVNGCCLTVTRQEDESFWCDLSPETLRRTGFERLREGAQLNLEAPLRLESPLGGHIVQGHVDGVGTFLGLAPAGDGNHWLDVEAPAELRRYLVEKGSVAVEGISLTVAGIEDERFRIAIIPFTYENTNLRTLSPGDPVNLECDIVAKYVEKLLAESALAGASSGPVATEKPEGKPASKLNLERLREEGF